MKGIKLFIFPTNCKAQKERAGQTRRIKYMCKVGWQALAPTPIPTVSVCDTLLSVHRATSGATSHHSPSLSTSANLNFTPSCLIFSTYFNSQTPHSKKEGNGFFSCTEDNSISAVTQENLGSAHYHGKYVLSCNSTSS